MNKTILSVALLAVSGLFTACQTLPYQPYAREVKKKPTESGIIALKAEHRDEDRQKAQSMMSMNCGQKTVKVLEEGEVVTGTNTVASAQARNVRGTQDQQVGSLFGMPVLAKGQASGEDTTVSSATTQMKEWQISYECVAEATAAPSKKVKMKK